jgi:2-amino-4-hydroxy-6-hydroxymethyldihydropteridine diphosphokinase
MMTARSSKEETSVYVLLGSNESPRQHLNDALRRLRQRCQVLAVSSVYQTPAQGNAQAAVQPQVGTDYWNMAVKLMTSLEPAAFKLDVLRPIEAQLGRKSGGKAVAIDLDIALWGNAVLEYGAKPWRTPHPDIRRFAYAALPLAELAPEFVHPETGQTLAEIAAGLDTKSITNLGLLPPYSQSG